MTVRIREAGSGDWPELWPIVRATVRAGDTYAFERDMGEEQSRREWLTGHVVLAEAGGSVLGSAHMGPNRPGPGAHVGTASFMVAEAARGQGVGRALGEYVVAWHRRNGFRAIQFNAVVETNTAAVALWTSLGFVVVGTVPGAFAHPELGYVGLHVMHLDLTGG